MGAWLSSAKERIESLDNNIEYINGYKHYRSIITIKCKRCGTIRKIRYETLASKYRHKNNYDFCPKCRIIPKTPLKELQVIVVELKQLNLEYISGYKGCESVIKVRCLKCGYVYEYNYHNLISGLRKGTNQGRCPMCYKYDKYAQKMLDEQKQRVIKQIAKVKQKKTYQLYIKECRECGETFITTNNHRVNCSSICLNKSYRRNSKGRYKRITIDKDITLAKLYKKSKGKCAICGGYCDTKDYKKIDGTIICGNNYPSIDHIKPISKGGKHSWNNVQLAHRLCNMKKSDKYFLGGLSQIA